LGKIRTVLSLIRGNLIGDFSRRRLKMFSESVTSNFCRPNKVKSVCIIIPCYGHARFLKQTLYSIENQSVLPDEVIFIDDCSPDNTNSVLKQLIKKSKIAKLIKFIENKKNLGQALSINEGLSKSTSDLIVILNDDDFLLSYTVKTILDEFNKNKSIYLLGSSSLEIKSVDDAIKMTQPKLTKVLPNLNIKLPSDSLNYKRYNDINMCHSGTSFFRKAALAMGGYASKENRIANFSDRDFQLKFNSVFSIGLWDIPFCFYRTDSSVDAGKNS
jgi:glycosyltransferase involved in cell wall biosynthesis